MLKMAFTATSVFMAGNFYGLDGSYLKQPVFNLQKSTGDIVAKQYMYVPSRDNGYHPISIKLSAADVLYTVFNNYEGTLLYHYFAKLDSALQPIQSNRVQTNNGVNGVYLDFALVDSADRLVAALSSNTYSYLTLAFLKMSDLTVTAWKR